MRLLKLTTVLTSIFLISCSGMFPGMGILAPETLGGYEMDATGMKGSYYYKFSTDGTYSSETILPSGEKAEPKTGIWRWDRSSPTKATLTLDDTLRVTLKFTTHEHANASLVDSDRLYPVEFTAP